MSRTDSAVKAIELAEYTDDTILPGMLQGETLRSPIPMSSGEVARGEGSGYQQRHNRHEVCNMETY